jgi:hypothetical protein
MYTHVWKIQHSLLHAPLVTTQLNQYKDRHEAYINWTLIKHKNIIPAPNLP